MAVGVFGILFVLLFCYSVFCIWFVVVIMLPLVILYSISDCWFARYFAHPCSICSVSVFFLTLFKFVWCSVFLFTPVKSFLYLVKYFQWSNTKHTPDGDCFQTVTIFLSKHVQWLTVKWTAIKGSVNGIIRFHYIHKIWRKNCLVIALI